MQGFSVKVFEFGICFWFAGFFFYKMFLILLFFGGLNVGSIRVIISRNVWVLHRLSVWKIQKCLVEQGSVMSRRRMMCSTRTEALGWRVGDRPLNGNGTEGGSGNPGVLLDVIEGH